MTQRLVIEPGFRIRANFLFEYDRVLCAKDKIHTNGLVFCLFIYLLSSKTNGRILARCFAKLSLPSQECLYHLKSVVLVNSNDR